MPAKEIKIALKEIREAIKNKENKIAIRKCDEILLEEPKNYMALVLMGAAVQEKDKKEAAKYLRKAVDSGAPDPTVALQGLANCTDVDELPVIYEKLLKLLPEKYKDYHAKILNISSNIKIQEQCIEILIKESQLEDQERIESALNMLGKILCKLTDIPHKWQNMIIPSLEIAIKDAADSEIQCECYKRYLKQLYKIDDYKKLLRVACVMVPLFPKEIYPLEWICKIYSDNRNEINIIDNLDEPLEFYVNNLINLSSKSSTGLLCEAMLLYDQKQFVKARDILEQKTKSNSSIAMELLAKTYMEIGAYELAINNFLQLNIESLELATCLSYSSEIEFLNKGLNIINNLQVNDENQLCVFMTLGRIHFNLNQNEKVIEIFNKLKLVDEDYSIIFDIEFLKSSTECLELLNKLTNETFEIELLKGKIYLNEKLYEKALNNLLKATKIKPYKFECFLNLGFVYYNSNDFLRAQKCFEKAVNLNPLNENAVAYVCAIYRKNEQWDLNEKLLTSIISKLQGKQQKFALFQQGLHFLGIEKFDDAIYSFRTAIRYDLNNILYWESLAESYQERGSYSSAMRVYEKILELDPQNLYAKLQIGCLQTTLQMYSTAISTFDSLLKESPDWVPALKAAAEAHYYLANSLISERLMGRAREHFQIGIDLLQRVFLLGKRDMIWLWRLTANIFMQIAVYYPNAQSHINVLGKLAGQDCEMVTLNKIELFNFAIKYYTYALKLNQDDVLLWHELAACTYYFAILPNQTKENIEKYIGLAKNSCKASIKIEPSRWQSWNLLGVLYTTKLIGCSPNYALAQSYFIRALNLEKNSAVAWSNLGVLYLNVNEIILANQAFIRAQQSDPTYVNCWIGQAFIAENMAEEEEAMDLFRHCTEVDFHVESAIGYAYWVSTILRDSEKMKNPHFRYAILDMNAVPRALDEMNWYISAEYENCSAESLAYSGYLNAKCSLWKPATESFNLVLKKSTGIQRDEILFNLGFCYMMQNCPEKAIESFSSIEEASLKSTVGLAWAYSQAKQYEQSYTTYSSALNWPTASEKDEANILVAMAAMNYLFQGEENTKSFLYQSLSLADRPMQALYSACAVGIIHKDFQLTEFVLDELEQKFHSDYCHHIAFLKAQTYLIKNEPKKALIYLLKKLHIHPDLVPLRKVVANFIVHNFNTIPKLALAGCHIAQNCIILGHINSQRINCMEDARTLLMAGDAIKHIDLIKQKKLIQKAVHLIPSLSECKIALQSIL